MKPKNKKKLLVVSRNHQLIGKGYSITFANIYRTGILQRDYEIHHLAWHKFDQDELSDNGVYTYCVSEQDQFGLKRLQDLWGGLKPEITLFHADPFFFLPYKEIIPLWSGNIVGWFTIDCEIIPPDWQKLISSLGSVGSLSSFGQKKITEFTGKNAFKIGLGVNHSLFYPVSEEQKSKNKKLLGLKENDLLLLVVGVNIWRKGLPLTLKAFSLMLNSYPDTANIYLYLHSDLDKDLVDLINQLGLQDKVLFSKNYDPLDNPLSEQEIASLYQSADLLFSCTMGEGFGMPFLEAAACGVPAFAPGHSSISEVIGPGGKIYPANNFIEARNNGFTFLRVPSVEDASRGLYELLSNKNLLADLGKKAYFNSLSSTWEHTTQLLKELFDDIIVKNPDSFDLVYREPNLFRV